MPIERLWQEALDQLKLSVNPQHFRTWIQPLKILSVDKDIIRVQVPNRFVLDWVQDNYCDLLIETLSQLGAVQYQIKLEIAPRKQRDISKKQVPATNTVTLPVAVENASIPIKSQLNPKYTFNTFVPGASNQFSHAAALAVANNPATTYNPLFIYGGVGLGKTHLVNAIGNHISEKNGNLRVCYYTSEKFMNELINSLRYNKMDEFRNKFRSIDVLLIDDVQFIAGKERTQEEFFHTFNALYESHKQIVVTSDKFPKDIPGLEERLRSRFEWGLIADIQPPDVETRQAILKLKAEQNNILLPEDVGYFLSTSVSSNVRELEGYLIRIGAYSSLTSTQITLEMAKDVLKDILVEKNKELSIEDIQKTVSNHFNIRVVDIKSSKRLKTLVTPRQVAMYLSRQLTSESFPEIGKRFGGKDHSTIIHAIKKVEQKMETDHQLRNIIENLKKILTQN